MECCSGRIVAAILLFTFVASEAGITLMGQPSICSAPSRKYEGMCIQGSNCDAICTTEGFTQGDCHGTRCLCSRICDVSERVCETPSVNFEGWCNTDSNCANVCLMEDGGFIGGWCHNIPRRCYCTKKC